MKVRSLLAVAAAAGVAIALAGCTSTSTDTASPSEGVEMTVDFPTEGGDLTIIVPVDAGGTTDNVARIIAPALADELGMDVQVVNKPGAAQQLGITELAQADPDGYTIGFTNLPSMISGYANPDRGATYTRESFAPVAGVALSQNVIAVPAGSPIESLDDLIAAAEERTLNVAVTGGALGDDDLLIRRIQDAGDVTFNQVPFDSGTDKMLSLLGGRADFIVGSIGTVLPQSASGEINIIALLAEEPNETIPDVPATPEFGVDASAYLTLSAPAGTDPAIVAILESAFETVMDDPEIQSAITAAGSTPTFVSAADTSAFWEANDVIIADLIAEARGQ